MVRLKVRDVLNFENGLRIIVECDEYGVPIGKAAVIVAGVMGQLATNSLIDRQMAKRWAIGNLSKKWKDHMHKLWHATENPLLSKEEIIRKSPKGIPMDQWTLFVNYSLDEKTKKLCKKNQQIRQNQIPHTGGTKSLARRRAEMAKGNDVDQDKM